MLSRRAAVLCLLALLVFSAFGFSFRSQAQADRAPQPQATPTPAADDEQEPVRVFTEEVRVPVMAYNERGNFDPSLELADVGVIEDGVPQDVRSVRRIPASVLLLLDTGGDLNPAKRANTTRDIALAVISSLRRGDEVAALQVNDRVEMVQDWTTDLAAARRAVSTRLRSSRRAYMADALAEVAIHLQDRPAGNRHVVFITDGVETVNDRARPADVARPLMISQATVHVISYTTLGRQALAEQMRRTRPRTRSNVPEETIMTLPPDMQRVLRQPGGVVIDLDREMRRRRQDYEAAMRESEQRLAALAAETGGRLHAPDSADNLIAQGREVARDIGAQYVITYTPRRPLAAARPGEYRRLEVVARRIGLTLRARRGYIVTTATR